MRRTVKGFLQGDRLLPIFSFVLKSRRKLLGDVHEKPAAPGLGQLYENGTPVPSRQQPQFLSASLFRNQSTICMKLSLHDIGMQSAKKRQKQFHVGSKRKKNQGLFVKGSFGSVATML